jgi:hypothetical protein
MVEAKKNERANSLKEVKRLCKEFEFTAGMLKDSLAEGRKKKMKKIVKELYALKRKKATWLSLITKKISGKYTEGFFVQTGDFRFIVGSEDMSVGRTLRKKAKTRAKTRVKSCLLPSPVH